MFDSFDLNVTQISEPKLRHEWRDKGSRTGMSSTGPAQAPVATFLPEGWVIQRSAGVSGAPPEVSLALQHRVSAPAERSAVEIASDARIRLLQKQFEKGVDREELARINILSDRLNRLVPRTTSADIDALGDVVQQVESLARDLDAMAARFGFE